MAANKPLSECLYVSDDVDHSQVGNEMRVAPGWLLVYAVQLLHGGKAAIIQIFPQLALQLGLINWIPETSSHSNDASFSVKPSMFLPARPMGFASQFHYWEVCELEPSDCTSLCISFCISENESMTGTIYMDFYETNWAKNQMIGM